jgi:hypothetical protein
MSRGYTSTTSTHAAAFPMATTLCASSYLPGI